MKNIGQDDAMIRDNKTTGDIKCAEIKTIPSINDKKPTFKIGEYNRSTASFEMNSKQKLDFDLNSETSGHYFKSSFARSMAVNQSKSLDYAFINRNNRLRSVNLGCENLANNGNGRDDVDEDLVVVRGSGGGGIQNDGNEYSSLWQVPGKENWDLRIAQQTANTTNNCDNDISVASNKLLEEQQTIKARRSTHNLSCSSQEKSDIIEQHLRHQPGLLDRPGSRASSSIYNRSISSYSDRRLDDLSRSSLTASCRSNYQRPLSSVSDVDSVMLQSQITTLQWQLKQAESSRQMYRDVMEQVVAFLQKTQDSLDLLQSKHDHSRFPRSRSVHTVDTSPSRMSPSRSESNVSFHRAKSISQMGDPDCPKHGSAIREMTWRHPRKQVDESQVASYKLSEEAFRLLRTVQSLLNTKEPDLTQNLHSIVGSSSEGSSSPANVDASSASSTVSAALDNSDEGNHSSNEVPTYSSQERLRNSSSLSLPRSRKSIDSSVASRISQHEDYLGLQSAFGGHCSPIPGLPAANLKDATVSLSRRHRRHKYDDTKSSPQQLSISSADDESGFSSLNSFPEIGLPLINSTMVQNPTIKKPPQLKESVIVKTNGQLRKNYEQDVGLPVSESDTNMCKIHRRWSITPADHLNKMRPGSLCGPRDVIRVLWV